MINFRVEQCGDGYVLPSLYIGLSGRGDDHYLEGKYLNLNLAEEEFGIGILPAKEIIRHDADNSTSLHTGLSFGDD